MYFLLYHDMQFMSMNTEIKYVLKYLKRARLLHDMETYFLCAALQILEERKRQQAAAQKRLFRR